MPNLLIIDNDPRVSAMLQLTLRSLGFETKLAATVEEGVAELRLKLYDLVVLDAHLSPERDEAGLDVLEHLVAIQPDTPTVVITDDGDPRIERRAWRRGANAFHRKPLDAMHFLHDVIQLCTWSPGSTTPFEQAGSRTNDHDEDRQSV